MKLQTKFSLGIIAIFVLLAAFMAALSINFVNNNTIREAEDRIRIYMRAAWEIHDGKIARTRAALEILAQDRSLIDVLAYGGVPDRVRPYLESVRRDQKMDILNVMAPDGKVLLRTRVPYNKEDTPAADALVKQVIATRRVSFGAIVLEQERLDVEGSELIERVLAVGSEPRAMFAGAAMPVIEDGKLVGIIEMGTLLNGATEKVDTIRDAVFENKTYNGKPVGTATIFLGDLRISTNAARCPGPPRGRHARLEGGGRSGAERGAALDRPCDRRGHALSGAIRSDPRPRWPGDRHAVRGRVGAEVSRSAHRGRGAKPGRDPGRHDRGLPRLDLPRQQRREARAGSGRSDPAPLRRRSQPPRGDRAHR